MSFGASDAPWLAWTEAASFTRFHASLALSRQSALLTKASIIWIASIKVAVVAVVPGVGLWLS